MPKFNNTLSVVVPTYNRDIFVSEFIRQHIQQFEENKVLLCFFDNASTDNTENVVQEWIKKSSVIKYIRNKENVGAAKNVVKALSNVETDYAWLLGDTYILPQNGLSTALNELQQLEPDSLIFNIGDRGNRKDIIYKDNNKILFDLGPVTSCLSSIVYSKQMLLNLDENNLGESFYPHTIILYESLAKKPSCLVKWLGNTSVNSLCIPQVNKSSWLNSKDVFEIGLRNWFSTIYSLPSCYTKISKDKAVRDECSYVVKYRHLIQLRCKNYFNKNSVKVYENEFKFYVEKSYFLIKVISVMPLKLCYLINSFNRFTAFLFRPKNRIADWIPRPLQKLYKE